MALWITRFGLEKSDFFSANILVIFQIFFNLKFLYSSDQWDSLINVELENKKLILFCFIIYKKNIPTKHLKIINLSIVSFAVLDFI